MLAANSATQGCNKVARSGRKIEQNEGFQNQGLKTGSFAVTHGRTPIVASMLLIFPCVRLDCVSSASKTCLDYVWSVNVFMLSV